MKRSHHAWYYADPSTLEGAFQIGHGRGAYQAHREPEAASAVYRCIRRDHRWDSSVDDNDIYLARLVRDLDLDPAPILEQLLASPYDLTTDADPDRPFDVALDVLATLARDDLAVRESLRQYVRDGEFWIPVLQELATRCPEQVWDDLLPVAHARLRPEDAEGAWGQPWDSWALHDAEIRATLKWRAYNGVRSTRPRPLTESTDHALMAMVADRSAKVADARNALFELTHRSPDAELLALVDQRGAGWWVPGLGRAVEHAATADLRRATAYARDWIASADHQLSWFGAILLAQHGTAADIPLIVAEMERMWQGDDLCHEGLIGALVRLGPEAALALPFIRMLWRQTPHSMVRTECLRAWLAIDPARTGKAVMDGMHDSQEAVRLLSVQHSPNHRHARAQLTYLRDDPLECDAVRTAARARLRTIA